MDIIFDVAVSSYTNRTVRSGIGWRWITVLNNYGMFVEILEEFYKYFIKSLERVLFIRFRPRQKNLIKKI